MENHPVTTVSRTSSHQERELALKQIYQQVLERQPYEDERRGALAKLEKDFMKNKIGVRRFLKELGTSDIYLDAFYYRSANPKFVENCLKHFLGRAVKDTQEMHACIDVLLNEGLQGLIQQILDSEEYRKAFGCFTVPYPREHNCYESPKLYYESQVLTNEHYGRRGWSLPTMYWHQLGLNCDRGVCHPEIKEFLNSRASRSEDPTPDSLLGVMGEMGSNRPAPAKKAAAPARARRAPARSTGR